MKALVLFVALSVSRLVAGESIVAGNFEFRPAKPWVVQEVTSHMVKGALTYGEKGPLLKFYHFGKGQGGGVQANVQRWKKQFEGEVKVTQEKIMYDEQEVAIVLMEGIFLDGGIMERKTPKEGYAMLGAVIPHESGDVFLKMSGPAAEVKKSHEDFKKLIVTGFTGE
ncbi:MAG: hypothetical protein ACSHYF_16035 [Verrucomicrobiaceae bacterium]